MKYTKDSVPGPLGETIEFYGSPYEAAIHYESLGHVFDGSTYVQWIVVSVDNRTQIEMFGWPLEEYQGP